MGKMFVEDVARKAIYYKSINPSWRWGQAAFNACYELFPDIADIIRGTECDPFYDDSRLEKFINKVNELNG
jgi:hypothetical protein